MKFIGDHLRQCPHNPKTFNENQIIIITVQIYACGIQSRKQISWRMQVENAILEGKMVQLPKVNPRLRRRRKCQHFYNCPNLRNSLQLRSFGTYALCNQKASTIWSENLIWFWKKVWCTQWIIHSSIINAYLTQFEDKCKEKASCKKTWTKEPWKVEIRWVEGVRGLFLAQARLQYSIRQNKRSSGSPEDNKTCLYLWFDGAIELRKSFPCFM